MPTGHPWVHTRTMTSAAFLPDLPDRTNPLFSAGDAAEASLLDAILRHAGTHPSQLAVKDDDESVSFAELAERVAVSASGLAQIGVQEGDRIILSIPNSSQFVIAALACLWLGSPFIPIATDDPASRRARIMKDSSATWSLALGSDHRLAGSRIRADGGQAQASALPTATGTPPRRADDGRRDAYVIYTSGTTGMPKG